MTDKIDMQKVRKTIREIKVLLLDLNDAETCLVIHGLEEERIIEAHEAILRHRRIEAREQENKERCR